MTDLKKKPIKPSVDAYRRTNVMTANRETILLMMYAGAMRFLKQGIEAGEKGQILEQIRLVGKTLEIVSELRSTLNFEVGGEIALRLDNLYHFVTKRLLQGNLEKNTVPLKEALDVLGTLNAAWEEAIASLKKERPTTP